MGETHQEAATHEALDDFFEPVFGDFADEEYAPAPSSKQRLAEKRRRAEQRMEERRLREELGYYDLELGDF